MKKKFIGIYILAAIGCLAAPPQYGKLARELTQVNQDEAIPVIIQWKHKPGATHDQKIAALGGGSRVRFHSARAGLYRIPAWALQSLANDPEVAFVSPDRPISAQLDNTAAAVNA